MPATRYKIWQVGNPVNRGIMQSLYVGVNGIAKCATPDLPHVVSSELVCNQLARAILLPAPPGFVIEHDGKPYYASLDFNLSGQDLPPAIPSSVVLNQPNLACGIVIYDTWIVNPDRHTGNIAYDQAKNKVQVYDHSHALFYGEDFASYLDNNRDEIGIGDHCLLPEITDLNGFIMWNERINSIPDYFIREVILSAVDVGLPEDKVQYCADYLIERRRRLMDLLRKDQSIFPKVKESLWDQIKGGI